MPTLFILTGTGALRLLPPPRLVRATSQRTFPEKRLTAKSWRWSGENVELRAAGCEKGGEPQQVTMV